MLNKQKSKRIKKGNNNKKMSTAPNDPSLPHSASDILKVKKLTTHWVQTGFFEWVEWGGVGRCGGGGTNNNSALTYVLDTKIHEFLNF